MVSEKGRGLALRRRAAKRRAYGEVHTPCAIAILYRKVEVRTFLLNIVFNLVNELGIRIDTELGLKCHKVRANCCCELGSYFNYLSFIG